MEDQGVHWLIVVKNPDGYPPSEPLAARDVACTSATPATASCYGPGFYGNRTACGQTMLTMLGA